MENDNGKRFVENTASAEEKRADMWMAIAMSEGILLFVIALLAIIEKFRL